MSLDGRTYQWSRGLGMPKVLQMRNDENSLRDAFETVPLPNSSSSFVVVFSEA